MILNFYHRPLYSEISEMFRIYHCHMKYTCHTGQFYLSRTHTLVPTVITHTDHFFFVPFFRLLPLFVPCLTY